MGAPLRFQIEFCGWTPSKGTGDAAHYASKNFGIPTAIAFSVLFPVPIRVIFGF
jgi:hypothetical protein